MAITLDSVLNFIIPIAVWIFIGYILYKPFKEPIDALINKIREWREGKEETNPWESTYNSLEYE